MKWRCYTLAVVAVVFSGCFLTVHSFVRNVREPHQEADGVCATAACISAAADMMKKMNSSADPCKDFNEFACGRFIKEYVLPEGETDISAFEILTNNMSICLHDLLVNTTGPTRPQYVRNIQRFFKSCVNETQIEVVGLAPYFNDREFADDWPTLNANWSEADFDLNQVIARYAKISVFQLFKISVDLNHTDVSKHVIKILQPVLGISRKSLRDPSNNSHIQAYKKYLVETAVAMNISRVVAERDVRDLIDLEMELTSIEAPEEMHEVKLNQFSRLYPRLDIERAIRSVFSTVNITLANDETVIIMNPRYIKDIESVLECVSKRTIQNLFAFKYAVVKVNNLTWRLRQIHVDYYRSLIGTYTEEPRWQFCVDFTAKTFGYGISKMYVNRGFSHTAKSKVNTMIDELQNEFRKMIEEAAWMSNSTKSEAFVKLAGMRRKVGYPDTGFEEADLERIYENHTMSEDNFYNNIAVRNNLIRLEERADLRKPADTRIWPRPPYMVNAHAVQWRNEIVMLAGIMQAPFYSESFPDYFNYGAIGYFIGHEITNLFDYWGSLFDQHGNMRNWWTAEDRENFINRTRCIANQYSNFYINEINMHLDGEKNRDESEGDTGGLKQSFRAYKQHVLSHGQQPRLPDLNLSQDQLFFLSFAQVYCQKITDDSLILEVMHGHHPPGKYRIIGTLQNSQDFARAYNCPRGSYMNPQMKCGVW